MDAWQLNLDCSIRYEIRVWGKYETVGKEVGKYKIMKKLAAGNWQMEFRLKYEIRVHLKKMKKLVGGWNLNSNMN